MIDSLRQERLQYFWIIFHVLLGVVSTYTPIALTGWVYLIAISLLWTLLRQGNTTGVVHYFLVYYLGIEILARMAKASPYIPYESGKYFMFFTLILGIFFSGNRMRRKSTIGWIILLLSLPSIFLIDNFTYKAIVFNYLGILNMALALIYFSKNFIRITEVSVIFRICLYSIIAVLASVIVRTPDFNDIEFSLAANFETTGDFGSNQVSTILSLGFLLFAFSLIMDMKIFRHKWITAALGGILLFRALLTFSRGGVVAAVVVIAGIIFFTNIYKLRGRINLFKAGNVIVFIVLSLGISYWVNSLTSNVLLLRYQGETAATLAGRREKDMSVLTSNRSNVFLSDMEIWQDNFFLGTGPGDSAELREGFGDIKISSHIEVSRLVAEHGLPGLFICLIFIFYPFKVFLSTPNKYEKIWKYTIFSYALLTSFHSAMRTNVTPLLYGLATVIIIYEPMQSFRKTTKR